MLPKILTVLEVAKNTGHHLVQVLKTIQASVAMSKGFHRDKDDRIVLAGKSIRQCVHAYLKFRIFKVGDQFLLQKSGAPIGGPMSSALLGLNLASCESIFDKIKWPQEQFTCEGQCRSNILGLLRYEDDLLACSYCLCLCDSRVDNYVETAYQGEMSFDHK